jgi:hypothetical protein
LINSWLAHRQTSYPSAASTRPKLIVGRECQRVIVGRHTIVVRRLFATTAEQMRWRADSVRSAVCDRVDGFCWGKTSGASFADVAAADVVAAPDYQVFPRATMKKYPSSSTRPLSPVENQPSTMAFAVAPGKFQ